jgi:hypothetical protein
VLFLILLERITAEKYPENATKSGFILPHVRSKVTNGSNRKDKRIVERVLLKNHKNDVVREDFRFTRK